MFHVFSLVASLHPSPLLPMILRSRARPQSGLRSLAKQCQSQSFQQQRRNIHHIPPLGGQNNEFGTYFQEHGVPGFLSPKTFRQTWSQYQQHLVDQINERVPGTEYESKSPYQMHVEFSRQPEHADFYNITAMAHFNHLWWESLSPEKKEMNESLKKDIEEDFHSLDHLRTEMLEHADAIFGNGFVWLMKENSPGSASMGTHAPLRLLCTYNAGSPYSEAYRMRQNRDMATLSDPAEQRRLSVPQNTVGSFGSHSRAAKEGFPLPNALEATPLLCLNVWQHMWIPDYGILGRRAYLAAWWERINWDVVFQRYNQQARLGATGGYRLNFSRPAGN